ncbi:protein-glutamate methylesterase/protein-glutamine glutaminase [Paenibacillus sp. Soil522]|uniref:protein-glutamate methylesterase/protein-glutamine glutaminase n=1 Tax=Paenibacillus sp. Soil522 TaxID=1736388 RepID=UPI0006FC80EE|nr:chemotaxis response regulator protein-glutamate methylesterase [Paenibacillus sp. Soil522]KRE39860.1 response regulator receiver protein [Paenibacillus sp. Soil522]
MAPYRILVVDDSGFMRKFISDLIVKDPQFTIVATAENGLDAIEAVREWKPDAVTLDLEMPLMNGIEALKRIMKDNPTPVIMLSGISEDNTRETIKALQFGAFDFIRKPSSAISNDIHQVGEVLLEKLRFAVLTKRHQPVITISEMPESIVEEAKPIIHSRDHTLKKPLQLEEPVIAPLPAPIKDRYKPVFSKVEHKQRLQQEVTPLHTKPKGAKPEVAEPSKAASAFAARKSVIKESLADAKPLFAEPPSIKKAKFSGLQAVFKHIVAIGTSTGGPRALHEVITSLPADFPAPVLIVQHMPPKFTKSLAQRLDSFSGLHVVEAEQGQRVVAGVVYLAPGGYHMELAKDSSGYLILLTEQPQRNGHRPSVDVLFDSLTAFRELKRHAVIMTGMGSDGAKGMKLLVECGAETTIAEAEETCVVYGMPRSAVEAGCVGKVLPLQHIAPQLVQAVLK